MGKYTIRLTDEDERVVTGLLDRHHEDRKARGVDAHLPPITRSAMVLVACRHGLLDFQRMNADAAKAAEER